MNWKIFFVFAVVNTGLCLLQLMFQKIETKKKKIPTRHSLLPGTNQKFLCYEDYYTPYGDIFGLVWIMNGFYTMVPLLSNYELLAFGPLCAVSAISYVAPRLSTSHKPTWGEPTPGKISTGGYIHMFYYAIQLAMGIMCVYGAIVQKMTGIVLITSLMGGLIWAASCIADLVTGKYSSLEKS